MAGEVGGGVHGANRLMGNSLLDVTAFGRIAGQTAGAYAKERTDIGELTVEHVRKFHKELDENRNRNPPGLPHGASGLRDR